MRPTPPIKYLIIDKTILVVLQGVVTDRALLNAQHTMFADPAFRGDYPRLIDATGCTEMQCTAAVITHVARCAVDRGLRRAALVSNHNGFVQELMSLYATYTGDARVEVFRNREIAAEWLQGYYRVANNVRG